ncbi:transmembrane protein 272-like [Hydractinia symbiolongicarpus]|uniref:transmembrane protein 272-like n=1 Tax=Hydractinia symbiolongicarpus TaxID=13093 RepID=UPI00254BF3EF|nr:transmembrane protein 272-like [Hydractinia symbiolongicarpus]XP_057312621.1 transmembrane protein 272-like [Hydractinia symbiolongicarpus]
MSSDDAEKQSSQGRVEGTVTGIQSGAVDVLGATGSVVFAAFIIIAAIGVPIAMLIIGANNIHNCPVQDLIPIYLIVSGITALIMVPISIVCGASTKALPEENALRNCLSWINPFFFGLVSLFSFAWFFCGNVWVFRQYEPSYVPGNNYCDETTYKFAFWFIIMTYVCTFLSCCCSCCFKRRSTYNQIK